MTTSLASPGLQPAQAVHLLELILQRGSLQAVYQPIVDLDSGAVVAYEALARGPEGPLHMPGALFPTAIRAGLLPHLEWACRRTALEGAIQARLGGVTSLFLNVEPSIVGNELPAELVQVMRTATRTLRIVLELTERDLVRRPAELLRLVRWARENWWGVALDDVGAEPASLALLPFVAPDVVKLDMRLAQEEHVGSDAATVEAVRSYAQRSGAAVLAEGLETLEHVERARAMGATLGQGWYFGRPAPLDRSRSVAALPLLEQVPEDESATAFEVLTGAGAPVLTCTRRQFSAWTSQLESRVEGPYGQVLLSCFGRDSGVTAATLARYHQLAQRSVFAGVLVTDVLLPTAGVQQQADGDLRVSRLADDDVLQGEHVVTTVSPTGARVLAARPLRSDTEPRDDDLVEYCASEDRDVVLRVARLLMNRTVSL